MPGGRALDGVGQILVDFWRHGQRQAKDADYPIRTLVERRVPTGLLPPPRFSFRGRREPGKDEHGRPLLFARPRRSGGSPLPVGPSPQAHLRQPRPAALPQVDAVLSQSQNYFPRLGVRPNPVSPAPGLVPVSVGSQRPGPALDTEVGNGRQYALQFGKLGDRQPRQNQWHQGRRINHRCWSKQQLQCERSHFD